MEPKITLDTNCIIAIQENRDEATYIRDLLSLHRRGKIRLQMVAIVASEKKPDGTFPTTFVEFQEKIRTLDLQDVVLLRPIGCWGISFWDWFLWADGDMSKLENEIHQVLFPISPQDHSQFCASKGVEKPYEGWLHPQWRNQKCDVLMLWGHIYHHGDIFVTSDKNFHKASKKERLISLGAKNIVFPQDVVKLL